MNGEIKLGMKYSSYDEFKAALDEFSKINYVQFCIRQSRTLHNAVKERRCPPGAKEELRYFYVKLCCVYSGEFRKDRRSKNLRQTRTFRQGCPVFVSCILSNCGTFLIVSGMNLCHNHPVSEEIFKRLPQQRRLTPEMKEKVATLLKMKIDKKSLREKLALTTGKVVLPKDLTNIAYRSKSEARRNTQQKKSLSYEEKFQEVSAITEKINNLVSQCSGEEYERNKKLLEDILRIFKASAKDELSNLCDNNPSGGSQTVKNDEICNILTGENCSKITDESCSKMQLISKVENPSSVLPQSIKETKKLHALHNPGNKKVNFVGSCKSPEEGVKVFVLSLK